jgi:hypothetical protein
MQRSKRDWKGGREVIGSKIQALSWCLKNVGKLTLIWYLIWKKWSNLTIAFQIYNFLITQFKGDNFSGSLPQKDWITILKRTMGVWQGVIMDSLKIQPSAPGPTLLCPAGRPFSKQPYAMVVSGVARLQGGRCVAVFYPFGQPTAYAYDNHKKNLLAFLMHWAWGRHGGLMQLTCEGMQTESGRHIMN